MMLIATGFGTTENAKAALGIVDQFVLKPACLVLHRITASKAAGS